VLKSSTGDGKNDKAKQLTKTGTVKVKKPRKNWWFWRFIICQSHQFTSWGWWRRITQIF